MPQQSSHRRAGRSAQASAGPSIPLPFAKVSNSWEPFCDELDQAKVYIVHLDTLPWRSKRQIFAVPVLLNVAIVAFLAWRVFSAAPHYLDLLMLVMGIPSKALVDRQDKTTSELTWITVRRGLSIFLDFVLFMYIGPWPLKFFADSEGNPWIWRRRIGFQDREIIVRVSRAWGSKELWTNGTNNEPGDVLQQKIVPAVDSAWMKDKTGYLMMGADFNLEWHCMIVAHKLCDRKDMELANFEKAVLAWHERHGWLIWNLAESLSSSVSEEVGRNKIVALKDKLTAMGKESLFFRWIELIQFESSQPGGFTHERQAAAAKQAQELFASQGVDFDEVLASVGGVEEFPGFEQQATGR